MRRKRRQSSRSEGIEIDIPREFKTAEYMLYDLHTVKNVKAAVPGQGTAAFR